MVVVLDALESEKTDYYNDEESTDISHPLLNSRRNSNTSDSDIKRKPKKWVLSQKGQWCLRTCSALAILTIVMVNLLSAKKGSRDNMLLSSIVEDSSSENGLGCIGVMLSPEKAEKIFL